MPSFTLWLRNLLFTIFVPGTVAVFVPYALRRSALQGNDTMQQYPIELGAARWLGLLPLIAGVLIYCWCVWDFMRARGTPLPLDAPKELVVRGLYRYVRNPMYVGVLLVIIGQAILYETALLLIYAGFVWLAFHTFVIVFEEPTLTELFGESYERYRRKVGRWIPRIN